MPTTPDPKVSDGFKVVLFVEGLFAFAIFAALAVESPFIASLLEGIFHGP